MTQTELLEKLDYLRNLQFENEVVEFKEAKNDFDFGKLGRYFSALSNEASLKRTNGAWLVFGIRDEDHAIVGSAYRIALGTLDKLKAEIANKTTNRITFIEIYPLVLPEGRVVMFHIPPAPRSIPTAWEGHYYGRDGEDLGPLNLEELERIRKQIIEDDWSAGICPDATIEDLDPAAIAKARANYKVKNPKLTADIDAWDDATFLNKAKVTLKGKVTRTAVILLGLSESEHFLNPAECKIRWILRDSRGHDVDYHIVSCPLLLGVEEIYDKIRNPTYRYMKGHSIFPEEVPRYDPFLIREAINNCIAHQDFPISGRINVVEFEHQLVFSNRGSFLPESVERVVLENAPEERYRNHFLITAMFNLGLVDTIGGGIRKMFIAQSKRYFPLPEYTLSSDRVEMTVIGQVLDLKFGNLLARNEEISLPEMILLDKVQKQKELTPDEVKHLRAKGFIEGKKPNFYLAASVIEPTDSTDLRANYIRQRGFDDEHYKKMIIEYIQKFKSASKKDIVSLLMTKLPEVLDEKQKIHKINNLISTLRISGEIRNEGSHKRPKWVKCSTP
jgi:ATP-dependent DNA helicase RecG